MMITMITKIKPTTKTKIKTMKTKIKYKDIQWVTKSSNNKNNNHQINTFQNLNHIL